MGRTSVNTENMVNLFVTIHGNHDSQKKACTHPVVKNSYWRFFHHDSFGQRILRSIFFLFAWYEGDEGKQISCQAKAFSELKKMLEEKDSRCSMRSLPDTEENTSENVHISEGTVNSTAAEKDRLFWFVALLQAWWLSQIFSVL